MAPSFLRLGAAAALAYAGQAAAGQAYTLSEAYTPSNFFSEFTFFNDNDPNYGFVKYQSKEDALSLGIAKTLDDRVRFGVLAEDTTSDGRPSVRLESKKSYNKGLFIADFAHFPATACGAWPAYWMVGPKWPKDGEIDMYEGWNMNTRNMIVAHTDSPDNTGVCTANPLDFSAELNSKATDCWYAAPSQSSNAGCQASENNGLWANPNGGVYATEWTEDSIKIWSWDHDSVPFDILDGTPDPSSWGTPSFALGSTCDVASNFKDMRLILNINLCGDAAGNDYLWGLDCKKATKTDTCKEYVANNPEAFANTYFEVRSIKVYQLEDVAEPTKTAASSTAVSTSTSTSSSATPSTTESSTTESSSAASSTATEDATTTSCTDSAEPTETENETTASASESVSATATATPTADEQEPTPTDGVGGGDEGDDEEGDEDECDDEDIVSTETVQPTVIETETVQPTVTETATLTGTDDVPAGTDIPTDGIPTGTDGVPTATITTTDDVPATTDAPGFITSTIYSTTTITYTSCAPAVTNCPARTETSLIPIGTTTVPIPTLLPTDATIDLPDGFTTSTVSKTVTFTITSCPPAVVTNCPAKVTSTVDVVVTVCPVTDVLPTPTGGIDVPSEGDDVPVPTGGVDVPLPTGGIDVPSEGDDVPVPTGGVDVPLPTGGIDVPSEGDDIPVPTGGVDVPLPTGGIDILVPEKPEIPGEEEEEEEVEVPDVETPIATPAPSVNIPVPSPAVPTTLTTAVTPAVPGSNVTVPTGTGVNVPPVVTSPGVPVTTLPVTAGAGKVGVSVLTALLALLAL